jgi:transposase InsO family protein
MRYKASEKREIIDLVERSTLPVRRTLDRLGIPKSTFYGWYERYREGGDAALEDTRPSGGKAWNRLPEKIRQSILKLALERPELSARELAVRFTEQQRYFVSESTVYRLLKAHDLITSPAFISMRAADTFQHRPRLLSDNGPSYVSAELRDWLDDQGMGHTRGAPYHPMTQGKIERWHRSMKNQVLLENYYLPGELKARIGAFVDYYNTERYHESLNNLTPEDVYTGRGQTVLNRRRRIKQKTLAERRRLYYQSKAA